MTYSQEEAVNLDVHQLFVCFALALHQMGTLYAVFAKESQCVVLEKYLDVLCRHHALLHDF